MLFRETVTVYCENHTEHTHTLRGQNAEFYFVKTGGAYKKPLGFKGFYLSAGLSCNTTVCVLLTSSAHVSADLGEM
jgi:hypothetical protein